MKKIFAILTLSLFTLGTMNAQTQTADKKCAKQTSSCCSKKSAEKSCCSKKTAGKDCAGKTECSSKAAAKASVKGSTKPTTAKTEASAN